MAIGNVGSSALNNLPESNSAPDLMQNPFNFTESNTENPSEVEEVSALLLNWSSKNPLH